MAANSHKRSKRPSCNRSRAIRKELRDLIECGMTARARTLIKLLASRVKNQHDDIELRCRLEACVSQGIFGATTMTPEQEKAFNDAIGRK